MQHKDSNPNRVNANGRFLLSGNSDAPFVIHSNGKGKHLTWASTVCEPERESHSTVRLLALLLLRNRELLATRRRVFGFPALAAQAIEKELLARRRTVLGVRSWGRNRSSLRVVAGDSRAATMAAGA